MIHEEILSKPPGWWSGPEGDALHRRARWRLLRLGEPPQDGSPAPPWLWAQDGVRISEDQRSIKWRLRSNAHGDACETVLLLPRPSRATVCISSQVGCAVGCRFCATGTMGLVRQLSAAEILDQVLMARVQAARISSRTGSRLHLRNVVFMGMGEPLHNAESVGEAIAFLIHDRGFGLAPRHVTLSTVGVPNKMLEMARRFPKLRIALSLHAADPELRQRLVPRATNDLRGLQQAIREINALDPEGTVWIEMVLLDGLNDSADHALGLVEFCRGLRVEVNVIPYNEANLVMPSGGLRAPDLETQNTFVRILRQHGIFTTLRKSLGGSISAACGQLVATRDAIPHG